MRPLLLCCFLSRCHRGFLSPSSRATAAQTTARKANRKTESRSTRGALEARDVSDRTQNCRTGPASVRTRPSGPPPGAVGMPFPRRGHSSDEGRFGRCRVASSSTHRRYAVRRCRVAASSGSSSGTGGMPSGAVGMPLPPGSSSGGPPGGYSFPPNNGTCQGPAWGEAGSTCYSGRELQPRTEVCQRDSPAAPPAVFPPVPLDCPCPHPALRAVVRPQCRRALSECRSCRPVGRLQAVHERPALRRGRNALPPHS